MPGANSRVRRRKFIDDGLIKSFLLNLETKISVKALIVFGSRAKGDALLYSDYDIAVVSDNFQKMPKLDRLVLLLDNWDADLALEPVAYTEAEFKAARGLLVWDTLEDGVVFKDTGVFKEKKIRHEQLKKEGKLKKMADGWKFSESA